MPTNQTMGLAPCLCVLLACFRYAQSDIVLHQSASVTKHPGEFHKLSCSVSGFSLDSNHVHWVRQIPGKTMEWLLAYRKPTDTNYYAPGVQGRIVPSRTSSTSYIEIRNLRTEDTARYYCARGAAALDYWGQGTTVTVIPATPSPPILYGLFSSCEQFNIDGSVNYGCLAKDYSPEITTVSWKKDNEPITTGLKTYPSVLNKKGTYTLCSQLTISESEVGSGTIYCEVRRGESVWIKEIPGPVVHHPSVILTLSSSEEIASNRFATAVCSIVDFRPKSITVSWLKDGHLMDSGFVTSPVFEVNGNFSATSRLTIPAREWFTNTVYTCQVSHKGVTQSRNITGSSVTPSCTDPVITLQQPSIELILLEATVTLTCIVSNAPYGVNVSWTQEQKPLKSEIAVQPGEDPDSVISTVNISTQAWLSGAEFYCVVSHQDLPTPLRESIHKEKVPNPQEPSVSVLLPPAEEDSAQRSLSLTCLVRGFSPREIFVKWTVNDKSVNPGNYKNTEVMAENDNSSFFIYSLLSIAAEEWASGASYSCVVGHEAIALKIINRTVNKSSGKPSFVNISLALMDTVNSCQ